MYLFILPVIMGIGLSIQTAINSTLSKSVSDPLLGSAISFFVGSAFLWTFLLLSNTQISTTGSLVQNNPIWMWTGGILGVIAITSNIYLFPVLGSVQISVLPILGQIFMGVIIDQFGLFNSPITSLSIAKLTGILLIIIGILFSIDVFKKDDSYKHEGGKILFQIWAVSVGMIMSIQASINGYLGLVLNSSILAGTVSFTTGALLLLSILLLRRFFRGTTKYTINKKPLWKWLGGIIGALYAVMAAWLVPVIGTGTTIILAIFGQLVISAFIERYGLFFSKKNNITKIRIFGFAILLFGILVINFYN